MQNVALITGSYGGLGTGFVDIHAARHGDLILVGRSEEKLNAQAKEVTTKYGVEVRTIAVDLSTPEAAQTIVDAAPTWFRTSSLIMQVSVVKVILPGNAPWTRTYQ